MCETVVPLPGMENSSMSGQWRLVLKRGKTTDVEESCGDSDASSDQRRLTKALSAFSRDEKLSFFDWKTLKKMSKPKIRMFSFLFST
jgi:hypothetical protein